MLASQQQHPQPPPPMSQHLGGGGVGPQMAGVAPVQQPGMPAAALQARGQQQASYYAQPESRGFAGGQPLEYQQQVAPARHQPPPQQQQQQQFTNRVNQQANYAPNQMQYIDQQQPQVPPQQSHVPPQMQHQLPYEHQQQFAARPPVSGARVGGQQPAPHQPHPMQQHHHQQHQQQQHQVRHQQPMAPGRLAPQYALAKSAPVAGHLVHHHQHQQQQPAYEHQPLVEHQAQYQATSPPLTLLQQQLNAPGVQSPPMGRAPPNCRLPSTSPNQAMQPQPVRCYPPAKRQRFEPQDLAPLEQQQQQFEPIVMPQQRPQLVRGAPAAYARQQVVGARLPMQRGAPPPQLANQHNQALGAHQLVAGNPTPPLTPNGQQQQQQHVSCRNQWLEQAPPPPHHLQRPPMPHQPPMQQHHPPKSAPRSQQAPPSHQYIPPTRVGQPGGLPPVTRLTLPLRDSPLVGPFRLEHDAQLTTKVFHLSAQLFDALAKSLGADPASAAVVQELQFRAYLVKPTGGDSLLAANSQAAGARTCNWPESFELAVNQQPVALERGKGAHRAADIFQLCQPGDNVLEIQVRDCYCSHEFVLEAVDRPTLKAFMNSCFRSRILPAEAALQKLKFNFGSAGFLAQTSAIYNEYVTDFGSDQTRTRVSLRCPISLKRIRTPTRGHNCKHLQCFDLENFLFLNRERSHWLCPVCQLSVAFNMLELDQHQLSIVQALAENRQVEDVLIDAAGQWQTYFPPPPPPPAQQQQPMPIHSQQQQFHPATSMAKSTGTFHPQPAQMGVAPPPQQHRPALSGSPLAATQPQQHRPAGVGSPASAWQGDSDELMAAQQQHLMSSGCQPVRRPASANMSPQGSGCSGRRSANPNRDSPLAKKPNVGNYLDQPQQQQPAQMGPIDELSPLAAMERTIIQHEQQMGPPPFIENLNQGSAPARAPPNSLISPPRQQQQQQASAQMQNSPEAIARAPLVGAFSPAAGSPASRLIPAASPQQLLPHSPAAQQQTSISTPATPSSVLPPYGPETPATPGQVQQQPAQQHGLVHSPMRSQQSAGACVDHQPLSNGSASAGSITSNSTMTPSGQSLGSVGMGGDSRCGTAPLQGGGGGSLGLDEIILSSAAGASSASFARANSSGFQQHAGASSGANADEKSEILLNKLMMDSNESILRDHRNNELALALEEADWKQQLDRGKSEHLANFLNEPLMNKKPHKHQLQANQIQHQANGEMMLSGGLNPSDDDDGHSRNSASPSARNMDLMSGYPSYLDADDVDNQAGLPPDDSILDLFER